LKFLDFFYNNYLLKYDLDSWNYYNNIEHITNNASESFNNYLNNLFPKKPTFYKLIIILRKEESLSYTDYEKRNNGILEKKRKIINRTDEIKDLIENHKDKEEELICKGCDENDIIELWYKCLVKLNNKNTNLL